MSTISCQGARQGGISTASATIHARVRPQCLQLFQAVVAVLWEFLIISPCNSTTLQPRTTLDPAQHLFGVWQSLGCNSWWLLRREHLLLSQKQQRTSACCVEGAEESMAEHAIDANRLKQHVASHQVGDCHSTAVCPVDGVARLWPPRKYLKFAHRLINKPRVIKQASVLNNEHSQYNWYTPFRRVQRHQNAKQTNDVMQANQWVSPRHRQIVEEVGKESVKEKSKARQTGVAKQIASSQQPRTVV
mmetsp:Transcript_8408/g.19874  ORF Transcript_8408/g.19874 Transcript_8408/m.19874 type:complete len:246 (+) Transcript_8408:121-858(+)